MGISLEGIGRGPAATGNCSASLGLRGAPAPGPTDGASSHAAAREDCGRCAGALVPSLWLAVWSGAAAVGLGGSVTRDVLNTNITTSSSSTFLGVGQKEVKVACPRTSVHLRS